MGTIECSQPASKSSWDSQDFGDNSMVLKMAHFCKPTEPRWVNTIRAPTGGNHSIEYVKLTSTLKESTIVLCKKINHCSRLENKVTENIMIVRIRVLNIYHHQQQQQQQQQQHQIKSMIHLPLFIIESWNNGTQCVFVWICVWPCCFVGYSFPDDFCPDSGPLLLKCSIATSLPNTLLMIDT